MRQATSVKLLDVSLVLRSIYLTYDKFGESHQLGIPYTVMVRFDVGMVRRCFRSAGGAS